MSQEYRNTIAKQVSSMAETSKVRVRGHRQDARNALKKHSKLMAQDAMRDMENTIQEATDKSCKQIDQLAKEKSFEIQKS